MQLEFAMLDCKDNHYCPVAVEKDELTDQQQSILALANLEYLQKLDALQDAISRKYEPLLSAPDDKIVEETAKELDAKKNEFGEFGYGYMHLYYT